MRNTYVFLVLCLVPDLLFAQEAPLPKHAKELLDQAEKVLAAGNTQFAQAEALLLEALELAPDNAQLNARMGTCQLNGPRRQQALPYLLKAQAAAPELPRIHFLTAYALQLNGRWDEAILSYEKHNMAAPFQDEEPLFNSAAKHITECKNGKLLMAEPTNAEVRNLGKGINSPESDYGALTTADGSTLIFTSRRPTSPNAKVNKDNLEHFEEILTSHWRNGKWSEVEPLPAPVNTASNDASVGLFNDGRTLLIYRDDEGTGDLFESKRTGDVWSEPLSMGPNINSADHESSAWFSFDRKWLYFVSDRQVDNVGGQDIFRSKWDDTANAWGQAENLGPTINSVHDEEGVFVHPDGRTIYFSSKGHNTMGGYDVFRSRLEDGRWTKPENLGWPVNSPDDDLFFVLTANGTTAYLSSLRPDGLGEDDLYEVTFKPAAAPLKGSLLANGNDAAPFEEEDTPSTILVKGRIKDLKMLNGMEAFIEMMDLDDASLVARFSSDAATGEYMVALPAGRRYAMYVKANGFLVHSQTVEVPVGRSNVEMDLDVTMEPLANGSHSTMRNLFFASESAVLEEASLADIDQLHELLTRNAELRLEISGHTDSDGAAEFNAKLSKARAEAVRDRLVQRGIDGARLIGIGCGDSRPVAPNDSESNKALNRRTEVKVL